MRGHRGGGCGIYDVGCGGNSSVPADRGGNHPDRMAECGLRPGGKADRHGPGPYGTRFHVAGRLRRLRRSHAVCAEFHTAALQEITGKPDHF